MSDGIRAGLPQIQSALAALVNNPVRLDGDRSRFSRSPPPYKSHQSHNSTRSQSPDGPIETRRQCEERQWHLRRDHQASRPYQQFDDEVNDTETCIIEALESRTIAVPDGTNLHDLACETVKQRWMEEKIWRNEWRDMPQSQWTHETSPEPSPDCQIDTEGASRSGDFSTYCSIIQQAPKRQTTGKSIRHAAERRPTGIRNGDASRPFFRFIYQISTERVRIQSETAGGSLSTSPDINTRAYEKVKQAWVTRGIWDSEWGTLPGMIWKHERPIFPSEDGFPSNQGPSDDSAYPPDRVSSIFDTNVSGSLVSGPEMNDQQVRIAGKRRSKRLKSKAEQARLVTSKDSAHVTRGNGKRANVTLEGNIAKRRGGSGEIRRKK
ncbi:hypothetical protein PMG11_11241 [Penicillium brasilianum]|uniref:Uncharacterized protein n=1 Tax=Penicillium brasilianum TaxID=104259 RepID=A0A0F7U4T0_PENBI|nr:hypothetical protein PMG11_11241 [Penicillium brasilianum]